MFVIGEWILYCALIIITIFLCYVNFKSLKLYNDETQILYEYKQPSLQFDLPEDTINLENEFECTPTDLKKCKMSDSVIECQGCKNLLAKCYHFDKDIIDYNTGNIIPKNENENEGYCLALQNPNEACNPFHGDLALVKSSLLEKYFYLRCVCKNPGFIGNKSLTGACDTPFICNSRVKDINKPLEEMECECDPIYETTQTVHGIPVCAQLSVRDVKGDPPLPIDHTIHAKYLNERILANVNFSKIQDPSKQCIITGLPINGIIEELNGTITVRGNNNCLVPIKRNPTERLLKGSQGPDALFLCYYDEVIVLGYISSVNYQDIRVRFKSSKNKHLIEPLGLEENKRYEIQLDGKDHEILVPYHFAIQSRYPNVPYGVCEGDWPHYKCWVNMSAKAKGIYPEDWRTTTEKGTVYDRYIGRQIPFMFPFNTDEWDKMELNVNPIVYFINRPGKDIEGNDIKEEDDKFKVRRFTLNKNLRTSDSFYRNLRIICFKLVPNKYENNISYYDLHAIRASTVEEYDLFVKQLVAKD